MEKEKTNEKSQGLSKVLGPMHIWALGVGIVLVGEFMGWNFTVAKGGSIGSVIALWTVAMLYVTIVMMNTEMGSAWTVRRPHHGTSSRASCSTFSRACSLV